MSITGWFTEDFLLAELKTLRARERIPELRPANTRLDGRLEIPTLEEILALARGVEERRRVRARELGLPAPEPIGVYPETKHPGYFAALGLAMEERLVASWSAMTIVGRRARVSAVVRDGKSQGVARPHAAATGAAHRSDGGTVRSRRVR